MKAAVLSTLTMCVLLVPSTVAAGTIRWEPYTYKTRTGETITDGERGRLDVPENHDRADGKQIELSFIRFRSTAEHPCSPIVWLAGGPGDFGSDDIEGPYLDLVHAFQEIADVIALDQRGTGLSVPRLTCPENGEELPLDEPLDPGPMAGAYLRLSRECARYWEGQGVDLSAYNTMESARDLEDLREALGVQKLNLYGASYGTHLGLAAIRVLGNRLDRIVLSGVEGPDQTWKLPSAIETHFVEVARADAEQGGRGDLVAVMRRVLARLDHEPVTVALSQDDGKTLRVVVGGFDARLANRYFLGDLKNIAQLPAIYDAFDHGDYTLLGRLALGLREISVGSAMYYCMDCASGISQARLARIREEESQPASLVGAALNHPFPEICAGWPERDLGPQFRGPIRSDLPVLFISGTLDGHTPIGNVSELFPGFPNARHLVVVNATHQYLELSRAKIKEIMAGFFAGREPDRLVVVAPAVEFSRPEDTGTKESTQSQR